MTEAKNADPTWYEATASRGDARPPLTGKVKAEVCVIGGGLAGLTTALELARRGTSVVLLEAKRIAWAASGRNGGFVSNGFSADMESVAGRVGIEAAKALYRLSRRGTEFVRREIAEGEPSIKMGEGWQGCIRYCNAEGRRAAVEAMARVHGQELQFLDIADTRARVNSQRYFQSIYDPTAFHVHPLRYALMLAGKAVAQGARLHESSPVTSVTRGAPEYRVLTAEGEVSCGNVVYCVSSLDRSLHRATGRAVLPVATYIAVTGPLVQDVIRTRSAVSDTRRAGNYFRLVDGDRLLWGGDITTRIAEPNRLGERMKADMLSVFPSLAAPRIDHAWAGLMAYARHFMPLIGGDGQGQWWATAFGGHGLNTTAMAGLLLARAVAAKDDEYRRFSPFAPQWAGGPLGRVAVQVGYWGMQAKDRYEEWRGGRAA